MRISDWSSDVCSSDLHQYPNGQTCNVIDGCYYLCDSNGKPVSNSVSSAAPTQTPTCPAPGSTDHPGRYSCNPAHQYPNGQTDRKNVGTGRSGYVSVEHGGRGINKTKKKNKKNN